MAIEMLRRSPLNWVAKTGWPTWSGLPGWFFTVQAIAIILLLLLGLNRRLGNRLTVQAPVLDNSQAYIKALAGVLHKANSHDFVVKTITQSERLRLQKALGLGDKPVSDDQLVTAWVQQTGGSAADLTALLQPPTPRHDDSAQSLAEAITILPSVQPNEDPAMSDLNPAINRIGQTLNGIVVGQDTLVQQLLVALLAGGHVILEGGARYRQNPVGPSPVPVDSGRFYAHSADPRYSSFRHFWYQRL